MSMIENSQLKAFLLDSGLVKPEDIESAEKKIGKTKKSLGDILLKEGTISQKDLVKTQAYILGIPFINLEGESVDPEVLNIIPEPIARSHNIVSFRKSPQGLEVAMVDPEDLATIDFIKKKSSLKILPRLTDKESIKHVLKQYSKTLEAEFGDMIQKEAVEIPKQEPT